MYCMQVKIEMSPRWAFHYRKRERTETLVEHERHGSAWKAQEEVKESELALGPLRVTVIKRHGYRLVSSPKPFRPIERYTGRDPTWREMTDTRELPQLPGWTKTYNPRKDGLP